MVQIEEVDRDRGVLHPQGGGGGVQPPAVQEPGQVVPKSLVPERALPPPGCGVLDHPQGPPPEALLLMGLTFKIIGAQLKGCQFAGGAGGAGGNDGDLPNRTLP